MEKSLDIALRQQMNSDEMPNLGDIPALGERAKKLIAARKKEAVGSGSSQPTVSILDLIFGKYRMATLAFGLIGILFSINFLCTFNIDQTGEVAGTGVDTSLTVSSNTYLATLNQSTINEVPANTGTALTCISTFKN